MLSLLWIFAGPQSEQEVISRHCNGNVKEMVVYLPDVRAINRFIYFEDGTLEEIAQEQNNLRHGTCTRFWSNGIVMSQSTWDQGALKMGVMYSPSGTIVGEMPENSTYTQLASLKTKLIQPKIMGGKCKLKFSDYVSYSAYIGSDGALDFLFIWRNPHIKDLDLAIYNTLAGIDFSADIPLDCSEGVVFTIMISIYLN